MKHPRRLIFLDLDGDDLLLVGEEFCAHLPSRRADVRYHELEVGTLAGRLPAARAASVPAHRTVLLAYGNGALEALHLARGDTPARRRFLCDAPGGKPDPVAGLAVAAKPLTAWLLHASGHLREFRGLDATLRQLASGEGGATGA